MNDYSVPAAYGFLDVLAKRFAEEVAIICGASEIAVTLTARAFNQTPKVTADGES